MAKTGWSIAVVGALVLGHLLAFKEADMENTKRTYWWLSWFRSWQIYQQKELTLNHGFMAVEQQKPRSWRG
jgi:hypothetical protein